MRCSKHTTMSWARRPAAWSSWREGYPRLLDNYREHACVDARIWEICEFLHDVVKPARLDARFPHKVSLHNSCHGVRKMGLSSPSEMNVPYRSKLRDLLSLVEGVEVMEPERRDECAVSAGCSPSRRMPSRWPGAPKSGGIRHRGRVHHGAVVVPVHCKGHDREHCG